MFIMYEIYKYAGIAICSYPGQDILHFVAAITGLISSQGHPARKYKLSIAVNIREISKSNNDAYYSLIVKIHHSIDFAVLHELCHC